MTAEKHLLTGELAKAAGVNIQTLRYYERRGLLASPRRSAGGFRQYPPDAVRVVTFIKRAQELGFSLREIRDLLRLRSAGAGRGEAVRKSAHGKLADIDRRIADLTKMRDALRGLVEACACSNKEQLYCPILEALEARL